ncbi:fumarylacetoacetate hydrolase family protein [Dyella lutea]|uniref:Fumarylacetoacetate hydrolase family protein n=1 Tax=Dyella lutea TaxID=2950441 RepID=A0ABT1FFY0_9GAMM|nr:fumarylacetoacetate hydrolase family protein [Dyella lutea]MCP1375328.1 fumarylacetoacetate hydrolase family protein [Dyella lutea]
MRLVTYLHHGMTGVGITDADATRIRPLDQIDGTPIADMLTLIRDGLESATPSVMRPMLARAEVDLLAPIQRPPRNLFCVGKNYRKHAQEFADSGFDTASCTAIPPHPVVFSKLPSAVIGNRDSIHYPEGLSDALDYEAELAVVIGRGGRGIARAQAMSHVFGYTIVNDVTARDWQQRHGQWFLGKSFDTFCPMGPVLVTADELDASALDIRSWVNGELRQNANTRDLIFDIPTLIETISAGITLQPGDIIATGTPEGAGVGFRPPRFLQRGDEIVIEIAGIGRLVNDVS